MSLASVRILRLAFGTAASLWFSQAVAWPLSFIAPVITMFLLALPLPAPKLKMGIGLIVVMTVALYGGLLLLPPLQNQPMVGVLLLVIALYWSFYFTANGGSAVIGTFTTMGIAVSTAIGSVSLDAVLAIVNGVAFGAAIGVLFVWIAHACIHDSLADEAPAGAGEPPAASKPEPGDARRSAFRSLLIVLPVAIWFLFSSGSAAYVPVMIKVAAMGQQASNDSARLAGRSLLQSTIIGGIGASIGWQILSIAPTLLVYTVYVAIAALVMGPKIFQGRGLHPDAATWSYGLLTMLVILAPAVADSLIGGPANAKFLERLWMFLLTTIYAMATVYIFDAFGGQHRRAETPTA
jgi:hypothetical protein